MTRQFFDLCQTNCVAAGSGAGLPSTQGSAAEARGDIQFRRGANGRAPQGRPARVGMGRDNQVGPLSDGAGRHNPGTVDRDDRDSGSFRRRCKGVICLRHDDRRNFYPFLDEPLECRGAEIAGSEERYRHFAASFRARRCDSPRIIFALVRSRSGQRPIGLGESYKCLTRPQKIPGLSKPQVFAVA